MFSTKERQSIIKENFEQRLYNHIKENLIAHFKCYVKAINGTDNHIHILFLLNHNHSIQEIFHYIKGESSHWINQNDLIAIKFAWQIGYGAFSVGESNIDAVEKYIANQKEHHRRKTFAEEYDLLLQKYKIDLGDR